MKVVACLVATVALVAATSASAVDKKERESRKLTTAYAKCVVKGRADKASDAILSNASNAEIMRRYPALIDSDCMAQAGGMVEVRFGGDLYRYALADALVNARFAASGATSFADRLPLAHLPLPERAALDADLSKTKGKRARIELEEQFRSRLAVAWLSRYGECIVRQEPTKARLWLLTPPDGPEETSRINDLRPAFAACLQDGTLKFNRTVMRGTVAINYYRLALATPVVGKPS